METKITAVKVGSRVLEMAFDAENAFGVTLRPNAHVRYELDSCDLVDGTLYIQ